MTNKIHFVFVCTLLLCLIMPSVSYASFELEVSEPDLKISTGFVGDTLTLFGTVPPKSDIVILITGPEKDTTIRRKEKLFGLWIHAQSMQFKNVPHYYNVASSRSVFDITDEQTRKEHQIGLDSLSFTTKETKETQKTQIFQEALIQTMQLQGLYSLTPDAIQFLNDRLFKTRIHIPANVPVGNYLIDAFVFKNGRIIEHKTLPFNVRQIGLASTIHNFAKTSPFWYGVLVIAIAILSSFLAIILLRRE